MIAKILKPTQKFSGVLYSQRKISEGKASFSGAFNFPFNPDKASPDTFVAYLESMAACAGKQIKNRQFHATISTKGREHDEKFLLDISQKWMEKMGYGNQPYLVYFHSDSANNHVHIISSRIRKDGSRINAYMEGRRAGVAIRELMNENLKEKATFDIQDALQNYMFSTEAQFKMILESRGWTVREKAGYINLIKYINQGNVEKLQVAEKAKKYSADEKRIRQLRSIFKKYSGLPTAQFQKFMRVNFGVDIIFHQAKNHFKPYGYTVIDNKNKCVMKGGEIMNIEALLNPKSKDEHYQLVDEIIKNNLIHNPSYIGLRKTLNNNGYYLKNNNVFIKGDTDSLYKIPNERYKKLHYLDRASEANKFLVNTLEEAKLLSNLFYINVNDITINKTQQRDDLSYRDIIDSFAGNKDDLHLYLTNNNVRLIGNNNLTLLVDVRNHAISDVSGSGLDRDDLDIDFERSYERNMNVEDMTGELMAVSLLSALFGIFDIEQQQEHDARARKKKKRRQIKI